MARGESNCVVEHNGALSRIQLPIIIGCRSLTIRVRDRSTTNRTHTCNTYAYIPFLSLRRVIEIDTTLSANECNSPVSLRLLRRLAREANQITEHSLFHEYLVDDVPYRLPREFVDAASEQILRLTFAPSPSSPRRASSRAATRLSHRSRRGRRVKTVGGESRFIRGISRDIRVSGFN